MDKTLKFLIKLQADSSNLLSTARGVTSALEGIERRAHKVRASLAGAFGLSGLGRELSRIPGLALLTNPYGLLGGGIAAISRVGMQAEQASIGFRTLVGDVELATSKLAELNEYADSESVFSRLQVSESSKLLMGYGVAAEDVVQLVKQLGDISGGSAERLRSLALAFGQVTSKGRLMGQETIQLTEAGFNPLQELSAMTGKSYAELQEMGEQGRISAYNVAQAIRHATSEGGRFHGAMAAIAASGAGSWNKMAGAIIKGSVSIYEEIKPYFVGVVELVTQGVPKAVQAVTKLIHGVVAAAKFVKSWRSELLLAAWVVGVATVALKAQAIGHLALASAAYIAQGATAAWTAVQWLLNAALTANPIGLVITGIAMLAGGVVYCWTKFAGFRAFILTMWDTMKGFGGIIKDYVVSRIEELLGAIGKVGKAIKLLFEGDFSGAAQAVQDAGKGVLGVNSAKAAYESSKSLFGGIGSVYDTKLAAESAKQAVEEQTKKPEPSKISLPGLKGSEESVIFGAGKGKDKKGGRGKTGDAIATGGTRNTQITMHIGKLIERFEVTMHDKADTAELDKLVLSSINRALAISTSTDR